MTALAFRVAFLLIMSCVPAISIAQVIPNTIYRDPCVFWGTYDYQMGSATLVASDTRWGIDKPNLVATQLPCYDVNGTLLATFNVVLKSNGNFSCSLAQQHVSGELKWKMSNDTSCSRATSLTFLSEDGIMLFNGWNPYPGKVFMVGLGDVYVQIEAEIEQDLGETKQTLTGTGTYMDYFIDIEAVYQKD